MPLVSGCGAAVQPVRAGRLPPEVIQGIIHSHYNAFRRCYEAGLSDDPKLEGGVRVWFVISRDGKVTSVRDEGSDLPDQPVIDGVISTFYEMTFPPPENGIVVVVYPINVEPGRALAAPERQYCRLGAFPEPAQAFGRKRRTPARPAPPPRRIRRLPRRPPRRAMAYLRADDGGGDAEGEPRLRHLSGR